MMTKFKILNLLLALFSYDATMTAQQVDRYLEVRGMAELDERPLSNASATLYDGSTKVNSTQTGTDGTFSFRLEANKNYTVEVSKNGLVTKKISFNTTLPDEESGKWVSEFGMVMVRPCEGIDYSVLQKPVDIVKFNAKRRSFESDKDYSDQMMPKLQDINIKSANCLEDKYNQLIEKAEKLFEQKNYESARSVYQQASEIIPVETYAKKRTSEIDALLEKQKNSEEMVRQQAEQQSQQQARQQEVDNAYRVAVAQADALFNEKKYEEAKEAYAKALTLKPSESYPRAKSQEIDKAMQQKTQTEQNARKEDLNRNLDSYLDEGDTQFKSKNYDAAKAAYANALKINPADDYARQQVARIEKLIVNEQANRQKSVEDGYKNAVDLANAAMAQKQYGLAREQYQQALSFKPGDAFLQTRIDEADKLEKEQIKSQAAADQQNKQYQDALASADRLFQAKDLQGALSGYRLALTIKPGDAYAQQRIKGIENAMVSEQAAKEKALAAEAAKEKALAEEKAAKEKALAEEKAAKEKALAAEAAKEKALAEEKAAKEKALAAEQAAKETALAEEKAAKEKALAAEQTAKEKALAAEQAAKEKTLAEEKAANEKALAVKQARDKAYNDAIKNGDMYLSMKSYNDAKSEYNKALSAKPDEVYPKNKLAEIDNTIRAGQKAIADAKAKQDAEISAQYNDLIALADKAFDAANYPSAKENYQKALAVLPDSPYPKQKIARIDEINKLLAQQKAAANQSSKKSISSTTPLTQLNFKNDSERDLYLNDLKKKYPEGITLEIYKEKYQETRRYIIVRDDIANEFRDVLILSYRGHEYNKNGKTVTQMYFEQQVKSRAGEYYNETTFE